MIEDLDTRLKRKINVWLDQPISRRDIGCGLLVLLTSITAGGGGSFAIIKACNTINDEARLVQMIDHSNWLIQQLVEPSIVTKYNVGIPRTGYKAADIVDLQYHLQIATKTGWHLDDFPATMELGDKRLLAASIYNFFDENAQIFLSHVNFDLNFLGIPELGKFLPTPSKNLGIGDIDPRYYREVAATVFRIPEQVQWSDLTAPRFEARFNLAGAYPTRVRPDLIGLPKAEIVFNQKGANFSNQRQTDPSFFY
ncbi:hypothetical protein HYT74_02870 [Candidatus Daviesbacteria bacterium]|nr:hypothetical protein [Candidatus Daviesbacteria bacterium]